jgi:hypothetical protein
MMTFASQRELALHQLIRGRFIHLCQAAEE